MFAAPGTHGDAAVQGEGHVAADRGSDDVEMLPLGAHPPQCVTRDQGRSGISGAAGHPAGDGNGLVDPDVHRPLPVAQPAVQQPGGLEREVVGRVGNQVGIRAGGLDRPGGRFRHRDLVVEADGHEHGRQVVEAVVPQRADPQVEVDLRRHTDGDRPGGSGEAHHTTLCGSARAVGLGQGTGLWVSAGPGPPPPQRSGPRRGSRRAPPGRCRPGAGRPRPRGRPRPGRPEPPGGSCGAGRTRRR